MVCCPSCNAPAHIPYKYHCTTCNDTWISDIPPNCNQCGHIPMCPKCSGSYSHFELLTGDENVVTPGAGEVFFMTLKALHRKNVRTECSQSPRCPFLECDPTYANCRLYGVLHHNLGSSNPVIYRHVHCMDAGLEDKEDGE